MKRRFLRPSLYSLVVALLLAALVHVAAVLGLPHLVRESPVRRLAVALPVNAMQILPPLTPDTQPLPFLSPDLRYAMCHYDLSNGPVVLEVSRATPSWIVALFSETGDNFYAATAAGFSKGGVRLLLVRAGERLSNSFFADTRLADRAAQVTVPAARGLIVIAAPIEGQAFDPGIEGAMQSARCQSIGRQRPVSRANPVAPPLVGQGR
ncbi:MAG: DUF1254 domain-containing protein [Hyphomicrobiaceae bacterium]|nr:DUF1254 domain-containing protein [Hyphomicrobiaceae bacterium]